MQYNVLLLSLAAASSCAVLKRGPQCSDIVVPVSIQAENLQLPTIKSARDLQTLLNGVISSGINFKTNLINGTYNIAGRYCEPEVHVPSRANTVQLLVHGISYTRDYWSGLGPPGQGFHGDKYSWIAYASEQGYPTFSIDRLGNGISDRPDGTAITQLPAQVEVTQSLVETLRAGRIGGRKFSKVIYVGHSYGSLIGNGHSANYPSEVDAYVLTGYTLKLKPSIISIFLAGLFLPSPIAVPSRYGGLSPTYFSATNPAGTSALLFTTGNTDAAFRQLTYATRGTVSTGEFFTAFISENVANSYNGDVFLLTGQNDAIFCSPDALGLGTLTGRGNCGQGSSSLVEKTRSQYPKAKSFDYFIPAGTGHSTVQHYGAQKQFATVHKWLEGRGY